MKLSAQNDTVEATTLHAEPAVKPSLAEGAEIARGTVIGRYTILERLGSGGTATVYSAYDAQLERIVALKMLRPQLDVAGVRLRLLREAQAMARLKHPHVVTVYDVGTFGDSIYIAMEYLDGTTLRHWEGQGRPWREVLNVLRAAGRGLVAAHEAGLVHRDFKPDNVLVGRDGRVLVGDFGIALTQQPTPPFSGTPRAAAGRSEAQTRKIASWVAESGDAAGQATGDPATSSRTELLSLSSSSSDPLTEEGEVLGTPGYIAPEHLFSGEDDARSDQFSFCVTMYVMLYGKHPFVFRNLSTYCVAVQKAPEAPPSRTPVPRWVHAVIERGLRRKPEQRFASMHELLEALDLDPSRRRRAWIACTMIAVACAMALVVRARHRTSLRTQCSAGTALIAASFNPDIERKVRTSLSNADSKYGPDVSGRVIDRLAQYARSWALTYRTVAEATLLNGEQDAATMDRRVRCLERGREQLDALSEVLAQADGALVQHALDAAYALPAPAICGASDVTRIPALPAAPHLRARVLAAERAVSQASAFSHAGEDAKAETIIERVLADVRAIPHPRTESELLLLDGACKQERGDNRSALEAYQQAFQAAERAGDDALAAQAAEEIAFVLAAWLDKPQEGERWIRAADAIVDRAGRNDVLEVAFLSSRIVVNGTLGHPERNLELHDKVLSLLRSLYGEGDPRVARAVGNRGVTHELLGQFDLAVKDHQEAITLLAAVAGRSNPRLVHDYANLGESLMSLGQWQEAKTAYAQTRDLQVGPPGSQTLVILAALAGIENELERPDAALEIAANGLEVARSIGVEGTFEWSLRMAVADARARKGDRSGKAAECRKIVALQEAAGAFVPGVPYEPDALTCLGEAELALHEVGAALSHLERSVSIENRVGVVDLPLARFALAKGLRAAGREAARAGALAESARGDLLKVPGQDRHLAAIDQWLERERPTSVR